MSSIETNPLLRMEFRIPFDRIRAEHVEPAMAELLRDARARTAALAGGPASRAPSTTPCARWTSSPSRWTTPWGWSGTWKVVATYPELRAAFNAVQPRSQRVLHGHSVERRVVEGAQGLRRDREARRLTGERRRFLDKTIDTFRRHGADLDAAGKKRLEEIDVELAKLTTKFAENVLDSTNAFELVLTDETELAGLPPTRGRSRAAERRRARDARAGASPCRRPTTSR